MGKTKTAFIGTVEDEKKSSKQKYEEKMARKKAQEEALKSEDSSKKLSTDSDVSVAATTTEKSTKKEQVKNVRGKKYISAKSKVNKENTYSLPEAIKLIKDIKYSNFDETLEMHMTVKKVPTTANVSLPNSFGKEKKVVLASETVLGELEKGKINFDVLLATAEMMPKLVKYARILGPKGLMPNPKNGTLIKSEKDASKFSSATKTLKTEKEAPLIHTSFGKLSMDDKKLVENANAILKALGGNKQMVKVFLKSTMSPSVKIQF